MSRPDPDGTPQTPAITSPDAPTGEVVDDGQEEVFSHTAVERGLVKDPKALDPQDLARHPKSPGRIDRQS